jgi:hypothetical protein
MKNFLRVLLLVAAMTPYKASASGIDRDLVPNDKTAVKIAAAIMEAYLGESEFNRLQAQRRLTAELDGDDWYVCHCEGLDAPIERTENSLVIPMPIGLEVVISKKNGEIKELHYAK